MHGTYIKIVFRFSLQLLTEIFLFVRRDELDNILVFTSSVRYSCKILTKREFSRQFFEKYSKTLNFIKTKPVGAEWFHADRQRDRRYEVNSRFSQFCAKAPNNPQRIRSVQDSEYT